MDGEYSMKIKIKPTKERRTGGETIVLLITKTH
jgi:hypothetical protein